MFGLWASMGLELLIRSAIASVSPTLLADPDNVQENLLYALGRSSKKKISIGATYAAGLCRRLFPEKFSEDDVKICAAILNRRNDELHSGAAAFEEYNTREWLGGFYRAAKALAEIQGENLVSLFGEGEAAAAEEMLSGIRAEVAGKVAGEIAAFSKVFSAKEPKEQAELRAKAAAEAEELSTQGHHRVECPACKCMGTVQGELFGKQAVTHADGEIVVRQPVRPKEFKCLACGFALKGYGALEAARLGGRYTRTIYYSPEEYYGVEGPDYEPEHEYDNE